MGISMGMPQKLKLELPYDSEILLLGIFHNDYVTFMLTAILFSTAKCGNNLSINGWMK